LSIYETAYNHSQLAVIIFRRYATPWQGPNILYGIWNNPEQSKHTTQSNTVQLCSQFAEAAITLAFATQQAHLNLVVLVP